MTIKVLIQTEEYFSFFINDFPACPREGDLIRLKSFITPDLEKKLSDEQLKMIHTRTFLVDFVSWEKGTIVYPLVFLNFK